MMWASTTAKRAKLGAVSGPSHPDPDHDYDGYLLGFRGLKSILTGSSVLVGGYCRDRLSI